MRGKKSKDNHHVKFPHFIHTDVLRTFHMSELKIFMYAKFHRSHVYPLLNYLWNPDLSTRLATPSSLRSLPCWDTTL